MGLLTYLKIGFALVLFAGGFGSAWWVQGQRVDRLKTEVSVCKDANKETLATVEQLKAQGEKSNKSCQERLASKDATIRKLKDIDDLRGKDEKNPGANPLRDALNGMYVN
jgi:C4-dicarboxylate-specific signal transduction histidine kinase